MENRVDVHLHSTFSRDGRGSMRDFCLMAQTREVEHICFTEHVEYDPKDGGMDLPFHLSSYFQEMEFCRENYRDLSIYAGLEVGDPYYYGEEFKELVTGHPFDFIIAAAHMFDGLFVGDERYLKSKDLSTIYLEYFQALERILDYPYFDVLGHFDFPKRYARGEKAYPRDLLLSILKTLIDKEKGIEINTSALRKGCREPCPGEEILSLYKELGGEIVTLGSDAHDPKDLGAGIEEAVELLRGTGFDGYYIFKEREGEKISLSSS